MTQPQLLIQNVKNPKVTFKVVAYDPATGIGTLEGEYGGQFTRNLSKESLSKYGYRVIRGEDTPDPAKKKRP